MARLLMNHLQFEFGLIPTKVTKESKEGREKILAAIKENGHHTTNSLAEQVGVMPKAIEKHLAKLKAEGLLVRVGPDKGGHWEIIDSGR